MIGMVALTLALGQGPPDLFAQGNILRNPKGAYEDYVLAANAFQRSACNALVGQTPNTVNSLVATQRRVRAELDQEDDSERREQLQRQLQQWDRALSLLPRDPSRVTQLELDRAAVADFGPIWAMIQRGNQKPRLPERATLSMVTTFPEYASFRAILKVAARKARVELADGKGTIALRTMCDAYRFCHQIGNETLIARLVTIAGYGILNQAVSTHLMAWPNAGLDDLLAEYRLGLPAVPEMASAFAGERALMTEAMQGLISEDEGWQVYMTGPADDDDGSNSFDAEAWRTRMRALSPAARAAVTREAIRRFDQQTNRLLAQMKRPEGEWPFSPRPGGGDDADRLIQLVTIDPATVLRTEAIARTRIRLSIIAMRARQHAWKHGEWPLNLGDFLTDAEQRDPLSGKPYVYQYQNGLLTLKSLGNATTGEVSWIQPPRQSGDEDVNLRKPLAVRGKRFDKIGAWHGSPKSRF
ncbi:MAG: hypothetical protein SFX74_01270 [Fimbriimonadaceae bacterium]|nr:hypothetical protein [Fimbriimonadaceae bacterium]